MDDERKFNKLYNIALNLLITSGLFVLISIGLAYVSVDILFVFISIAIYGITLVSGLICLMIIAWKL